MILSEAKAQMMKIETHKNLIWILTLFSAFFVNISKVGQKDFAGVLMAYSCGRVLGFLTFVQPRA